MTLLVLGRVSLEALLPKTAEGARMGFIEFKAPEFFRERANGD